MFIDARDLDEQDTLEADVCVVGTGAAALPLALKLAHTRIRVLLLESGGLTAERDGPQVYRVVADPSPRLVMDARRTWFFGGNTNHWFGNCRPLDEADFRPRDWIPHSGWPIRREQLLPYYVQAYDLCGLGACRAGLLQERSDVASATLTTRVLQACPVPNLAHLYRQRIEEAENVRICLHARALRLETNAGGDTVRTVTMRAPNGRRFRVAAQTFVLAAGGVENPRLLLCSNDVNPTGLANANDRVGRFFMEHPTVYIPLGRRDRDHLFSVRSELRQIGRPDVWSQLSLSDSLLHAERLGAISLWVDRPRLPWRAGRNHIEALIRGRSSLAGAWPHGGRLLSEADEAIRFMWGRLARRDCLCVTLEQTPDPDNRIQLSSDRDCFGQPGVVLTSRLTDDAQRRHGRGVRIAAEELGLDGKHLEQQFHRSVRVGQLDFFWHHMGTTRMHADPELGVVNGDCRAHAVSNLFIAGSSVFPTSGAAPPTLTIVALSLRLAEHLLQRAT